MQAADGGFELVDADEGWRRLPPATPAELAWRRVYTLLQRLTFKRRQFGHLGQWLKEIKARGRQLQQDDGAARRGARGGHH